MHIIKDTANNDITCDNDLFTPSWSTMMSLYSTERVDDHHSGIINRITFFIPCVNFFIIAGKPISEIWCLTVAILFASNLISDSYVGLFFQTEDYYYHKKHLFHLLILPMLKTYTKNYKIYQYLVSYIFFAINHSFPKNIFLKGRFNSMLIGDIVGNILYF